MGFYRNGVFRVREVTANGVTTLVDLSICYVSLEVNPKVATEDLNVNCNLGSRKIPNYIDPDWSLEVKPTLADFTALAGALAPGAVIGFEVLKNPLADDNATATATGSQVFEVIRFTTITERPDSARDKGVVTRRIAGAGGDYYGERAGRTGFPAPYSSATNS